MHCPSCGQQQVSIDTKFCSRCGFPLGIVSEVLAHGGFLPQLAELYKKKTFFNKKNGVVFSIFWFIFFTMFLTSVFGIANAPDALIGIMAVTGLFGGLMFLIASLVFLRSSRQFPIETPQLPAVQSAHGLYGARQAALPPQQSIPASAYAPPAPGHWRDTNDLQPSVTESTTKLLTKEDQ